MNWKSKVGIGAVIVILILSLCLIIKFQHDTIEKQKEIQNSLVEQKQLADNIIRAQSAYVTKKDLETFAKQNNVSLDPIKEDLDKLNADVKGISVVRVVTSGAVATNQSSTTTEPRKDPQPVDVKNPDPYGYMNNKQVLQLNEPFGNKSVPVGTVGFSAWKDKPWEYTLAPREYKVVNVVGEDEDGKHYVYNKFFVTSNGKSYEVKVSNSQFVETLPESSFRFSPRLYAGVDGGAYLNTPSPAATVNMQLAVFSYGRTKPNPSWTFLGVGGGYEAVMKKFNFVLSPINYNIGNHLPLVDNVFIGPSGSINLSGDYTIMMGVRFGL